MIDIQIIRERPEKVKEAAVNKNVDVDIDRLLELDSQQRELAQKVADGERQRNEIAKAGKGGKPTAEQIERGKKLKEEVGKIQVELTSIEQELQTLLEAVPNLPTADTPIGKDESGNVVLRKVGEIPTFDFTPQEHWELGEQLGVIETEKATEISGSRFHYLKGGLVWLEFALVQHALHVLTDQQTLEGIAGSAGIDVSSKPFVPVIPPVFVKPEVMQRMARLEPKDQRYHTAADDLYLVGSAEHTLGPMHMDEVLPEKDLPLRYVGFSTAFRREAGTYGKDMKGILRVHQFDKLEIESFTLPEHGQTEQHFIVAIQEYLMRSLKLPYQVVLKCTGDMGTPNARAVDIETWLPGQNQYRETHTSDYMTDFQARRLHTKVKRADGKKEFVHMNDATVFAIGRTLIAIMENYQQAAGSIVVPKVLRAYVPFEAITV